MQKQISLKTRGMQRDLSASAFNSEYAYENKNVRIMPTDDSTLLSLINEKGNLKVPIKGIGDYVKGIPIGQALLNNELVLFTCGNKLNKEEDKIYKLWFEDKVLTGTELFSGDLGFSYKYPIETISVYENNDLKKVYWTDGLNQPRVINIAAAPNIIDRWNSDSFNFVRTLNLNEKVTIEKSIIGSGSFASGVIQYAFTYFTKYGQESNIFYTSPLYYISHGNRGASPEDKVGNSFNIVIENVDRNFDYVRVYSIHRSSIDATPDVKIVADLAISEGASKHSLETYTTNLSENQITMYLRGSDTPDKTLNQYAPIYSNDTSKTWIFDTTNYSKVAFRDEYLEWEAKSTNSFIITVTNNGQAAMKLLSGVMTGIVDSARISFTDNGLSGDSISPEELFYVGGEEMVAGTFAQKDNTLFLGDISLKKTMLDSSIRDYFKGGSISFSTYVKSIASPLPKGYYPYINQLNLNSSQIKTFKYLEWYRFGIQAQHYTGKWSEPIWINDVRNTVHIDNVFYNSNKIGLPVAEFTIDNSSIIKKLLDSGYINIRPVIVYPSINDRESICQGILCPTVYNVFDRFSNSPFAQSSWFVRPNAPFDINKAFDTDGNGSLDYFNYGQSSGNPTIHSRAGVLLNEIYKYEDSAQLPHWLDSINKGSWAEFRHNYPIPSNENRNAEIQCIWNPPINPYISSLVHDSYVSTFVTNNAENFYIDQSILTFHSPDIEFDSGMRIINSSNLKLRIVGMVPLTAFASDIDIQTSTPPSKLGKDGDRATGFLKESVNVTNDIDVDDIDTGESHFGWRGLISGIFWLDEIVEWGDDYDGNASQKEWGFAIYPWHRNGSLSNDKYPNDSGVRNAMLDKKKLSNMKFSYKTQYMDSDKIWNAFEEYHAAKTGISGVSIFDSNEVSLIRIPAQQYSSLSDISYYGNVDKILNVSRTSNAKKEGYPIMTTRESNSGYSIFKDPYKPIKSGISNNRYGIDPIVMKYKSTPHAVLALNYTKAGIQRVLPTIRDYNSNTDPWIVNDANISYADRKAFWDKNNLASVSQDAIDTGITGNIDSIGGIQYGWLWLGELYNDEVVNRFGGQTEEAFENNIWLPCGDPISLVDATNGVKNSITIRWEEGDTYYQRYDHIKTYPFTLEDQNAVTEIVSFMCETRVNIDGRYDRNRGQVNNLAITPENFNLMNDIYSQKNNFFNYRTTNPNKLNLNNFHNSITWTKTKTLGELVDTWTNMTLASTLDLDGDKGIIRALKRFGNNIFAFQDKGISQILYNENMQITSTEGVPIEIANSGKVNGKRYITDKIGCINKWSICETPNGIYFVDDITKGIFLFNGQLNNLSDRLGFHSWINRASKGLNIWNPVNFGGFVTYYDKTNGDVFFISKDECLAFSEPLGQFSSFYSYEKMPYFTNLEDRGIAFNVEGTGTLYRPWLHNEGDYNMFFGVYQPFYTTIIANPDMSVDKIFNNLEFRSDSWDKNGNLLNTTFDTLTVWNEYQQGISTLNNILGRPSNLKKKFRIWRANIPRATSVGSTKKGRDRMRNPWLYIKLSMEGENINRTILHDVIVHYFE